MEWYILTLEKYLLFIRNSDLTGHPAFSFANSTPAPNHTTFFLSPLSSLFPREDL